MKHHFFKTVLKLNLLLKTNETQNLLLQSGMKALKLFVEQQDMRF